MVDKELYARAGGNHFTANLCHDAPRPESHIVCVDQSREIFLTCHIPANAIAWKSQAEAVLLSDTVFGQANSSGLCTVGSVKVEQGMVHLLSGKSVSCTDPANVNHKATFSFIAIGK